MTGCTIFEIQGSDPSRIAGAVRCDRSAVGMTILAEAESRGASTTGTLSGRSLPKTGRATECVAAVPPCGTVHRPMAEEAPA